METSFHISVYGVAIQNPAVSQRTFHHLTMLVLLSRRNVKNHVVSNVIKLRENHINACKYRNIWYFLQSLD